MNEGLIDGYDQFIQACTIEDIFEILKDVSLNEAIWCFAMRYWSISYVIPRQLKWKTVPRWFKLIQRPVLVIGILANCIIPFLNAYYKIRIV